MSFGSFGSFGSMGASLSSDTISIEYFSGQPNPQLLPSELVSVFKNLMRKDVTTRDRGSKEMLKLLPTLQVDEVVHLAWVQLYVKLSFDDAASVRAAAHRILGEIYAKLGKASTKYLKNSLPCLFCGFYDQVADVQQAAKSTFEGLFTPEKRPLVLTKFAPGILEMCSNIVLVQTPATLSDERYVSKQESALKYERVLRQALDVLSYTLLDALPDIPLLYESKLWKLMAVEPVAKNVLNLAAKVVKRDAALDELVEKQLNKALQKPVPSASVELVRALLVYQKNGQKVSLSALAGYLKGAALFPKPFWPLFFNLAILVGFESPLKEALAGVALKVVGLTKDEVWGAFLALCGRSNNEVLATDTVFSRCKQGKLDVAERFAKLSPPREHVAELISGEATTQKFNFMLVLAAAHLYNSQLEAVLPAYSLEQVAQLVKAEPQLKLSGVDLEDPSADPHTLAMIASYSATVDAPSIAAKLPEQVLLEHPLLGERGVSVELGDLSEPQELLKGALSRALVGDEQAATYVRRLAEDHCIEELTELARKQPAFLQSALNNETGTALLNTLQSEDELATVLRNNDTAAAVLKDLRGDTPIDVLLDRAVALCAKAPLPELLPSLELEWPEDYSVYPVPWEGETPRSSAWESTLREAVFAVNLVRLVEFDAETLQHASLDLVLVAKACASIEFVSTDEHTSALASALAADAAQLEVDEQRLWEALKGNTPRAFYAAQVLYELCQGQDNSDVPAKFRNTQPPALVWALVAQLGAGKNAHWYVREQQTLRQRASTLKEFACLDPQGQGFDAVLERLAEAEEPLFQWVMKASVDSGTPSQSLLERALRSSAHSQRLALARIAPHEYDQQVAEAALELAPKDSEQSEATEQAFLGYCRQLLSTDVGVSGALETWLQYCLARHHALKEYAANGTIPKIENLAGWMLYIDIVGEAQRRQLQSSRKQVPLSTIFSEYAGVNDSILKYVQAHITSVTPFTLTEAVGTDAASYLLLSMCQYFGGAVRQWYRSITDKTLRAQVEAALQRVVPEIMKQVAQEANLESTTVSQKAREIRTMLEIDESVAQIVITLDPLFPVKSASVQLLDLAGVPEHKKRSWALEAEYTVQSGQVVAAMRTLRLKVEQFLEGIEPCAICYSVMLGKSLPSKTCSTCKNTYHSDCLYQWFHSNKDKLCPMCRTPF